MAAGDAVCLFGPVDTDEVGTLTRALERGLEDEPVADNAGEAFAGEGAEEVSQLHGFGSVRRSVDRKNRNLWARFWREACSLRASFFRKQLTHEQLPIRHGYGQRQSGASFFCGS